MKKSELKQIIREALQEISQEKEYTVEYWYRGGRYGDDKDFEEIKIKATSEKEALEKAKDKARRGYITSSFKIIK